MAHTVGFSKVKLEVKNFSALSSTAKYIFIVFQCIGQFTLALASRNTWYTIERDRILCQHCKSCHVCLPRQQVQMRPIVICLFLTVLIPSTTLASLGFCLFGVFGFTHWLWLHTSSLCLASASALLSSALHIAMFGFGFAFCHSAWLWLWLFNFNIAILGTLEYILRDSWYISMATQIASTFGL